MKTFKETFDENIWDRTKAKAAGAVAGAKSWAGQTARNVMGKDPADAGQAGAAAKLQAQADSLSKGAATKLQKLVADVENDLVSLTGVQDINEFNKANPKVAEFLGNIDANIDVLLAGQVKLPETEPEQQPEQPATTGQSYSSGTEDPNPGGVASAAGGGSQGTASAMNWQ